MINQLPNFEDFLNEKLVLEFLDKDKQRIEDIVKKSANNNDKMISLASTMAKLITDKGKAFNRGCAAETVIGKDSDVAKIFFARAEELGMKFTEKDKEEKEKILPGSKRSHDEQYVNKHKSSRFEENPILPCGALNLTTGNNKYFNVKENGTSTIEVWKEGGSNKIKFVITSGSTPIYQIGEIQNFKHDQTGRPLFRATMVDYIESEHMDSLISLYGKSASCYVYK